MDRKHCCSQCPNRDFPIALQGLPPLFVTITHRQLSPTCRSVLDKPIHTLKRRVLAPKEFDGSRGRKLLLKVEFLQDTLLAFIR